MNTRNSLVGTLIVVMGLFLLSAPAVMAQPIDYCEGNFDNDYDVDGTDAFVFKTDFGRSSLSDPCPVIECQTAEELEIRIVQLETQLAQMTALLGNVTRDIVQGQDTIRFSGVNVQIVDGSGDTMGAVTGLGNLIVGYNELRASDNDRTGSHNLVVGPRHNYSSYGGLVAGYQNTVAGSYASVSGGENNTAGGNAASVSGGARNTASGSHASVSGGRYNEASGDFSFVGGGGYATEADGNKAFGHYSAVLGGRSNLTGDPDLIDHTFAQSATVSGGQYNIASGSRTSVSGGSSNTASGWLASVAGGRYNEASGDYSFVGGGGYLSEIYGNKAFGHYSAVLGGRENLAGDPDLTDHTFAQSATVSGGHFNTASGYNSSVSGGYHNEASGVASSVSGGYINTASGWRSSVSGGANNEASDDSSSVSGGYGNTASGSASSVSGGSSQSATGGYDWRGGDCYFCDD